AGGRCLELRARSRRAARRLVSGLTTRICPGGGADGRELVDRGRLEDPAGLERRRREARVVGRIREVLRLEREPVAAPVDAAARSDERSVEQVAGVQLDP